MTIGHVGRCSRLIVTGAGGFFGSHLTEACVATGHQVGILLLELERDRCARTIDARIRPVLGKLRRVVRRER